MKKKSTASQDSMKLKTITIPKRSGENEKVYFFLSTFILILTCLIIIGACFGLIYVGYKQIFTKEQYFQFDEEKP